MLILFRIFDYSGLGEASLPQERISALGASAALFVAPEWELKLCYCLEVLFVTCLVVIVAMYYEVTKNDAHL
jgi:hypothetical protein